MLDPQQIMLDPQQIRLRVQHGEIPAHWRLIRGSASFAVQDYLKLTALPQFIGWIVLAGAIIGWISIFYHSVNQNYTYIYVFEALIFLLIPIIGIFIRAGLARNAALILSPEGCMILTNMNDNAYTCKSLWYASVADMQLHISFWGPYLAVKYYDGSRQKWYPGAFFGRRARTLQDILTDYTLYHAARSAYIHHSS